MTVPTLHVSRTQFLANIRAVRERIQPSELMLVMKDDAYGHGLDWAVAAAASAGVSWYGSYDIAGGLAMRRSLQSEGRIFAWVTSPQDEIADAIRNGIDLGVGTEPYLRLVIETAKRLGVPARVHLKIDTGLHRNGIRPEDWPGIVRIARASERAGNIRLVGVWSHLAEASDAEDDDAQNVFHEAVEALRQTGDEPDVLHLTASAASWLRPELRGSLSRVGAFCYGIRSADGPALPGVRPIAGLSAPVIEVRTDVVLIGVGSFDGLASNLAGIDVGTPGGVRLLRRIDTTVSTVDIWPGAAVGDAIWIFGPGDHGEHSATTLAERVDTVGEEIITRLTGRVERVIEG